MIEPTESEDLLEMDRYIWALTAIRQEIQDIQDGKVDKKMNLLKLAPFTLNHLMQDDWPYEFSR